MELRFFCVGILMYGLFVDAFIVMYQSVMDSLELRKLCGLELNAAQSVGIEDEQSYAEKNRRRWKKAKDFFSSDGLALRISMVVTIMRPALMTMAEMFERTTSTAVIWCSNLTSPAATTVRLFFTLLHHMDHDFWGVIRGDGWTGSLLLLAFTVTMLLVGNLFLRCVAPFMVWPWRLGILVHDGESEESKGEVVDNLTGPGRRCPNCFDKHFTQRFLTRASTADTFFDIRNQTTLRDAFETCPADNIPCENKFARQQSHNYCVRGRFPHSSTLVCKHVLGEFKQMHRESWTIRRV